MERKKTISVGRTLFTVLPIFSFLVMTVSCTSMKSTSRISEIKDKDLSVTNRIAVDLNVDLNRVIRARSNKHSSVQAAKEEAYYKAIVDNQIHVLVDPIYSVESSGRILIFGGKSTAEVVGYAGTYSNPRAVSEIEAADAEAKIASDKLDLERAMKNYVSFSKLPDVTTSVVTEKALSDGKSSPVVMSKNVDKTTTMEEYMKLLKNLKY
jgi:hypothetical protein